MMDQRRMFFIVGRGRSGTSLLQTILNQHPDIAVAPEAQFIMLLYRKYRKRVWNKDSVVSFYHDLFLESRINNWNLDGPVLKEALLDVADPDFSRLILTVYARYADTKGKTEKCLLGDKNPHYALFIKDLMKVFPQAKFIHLIRDARANALSYKNVSFDLKLTPALAYRWNFYNQEILKISGQHSHQFMRLRFEDLLEEPREQLERVCGFLGVEYNDGLLDFHKSAEWNTPWRKNIYKPLDRGFAQDWQRKISNKERNLIELISQKLLVKFSYPVNKVRAGLIKDRFLKFSGFVYAGGYTWLERLIYYCPINFVAGFLKIYRKLSGTWVTEEKTVTEVNA